MTARPSPTVAQAAALAAALARARTRLERADVVAAQSAERMAEDRRRALALLGDTTARLAARTRAVAALVAVVERRRLQVEARMERRIRALGRRMLARRATLIWQQVARVMALALIAGLGLWWGLKVWTGIASFLARLFPAGGP